MTAPCQGCGKQHSRLDRRHSTPTLATHCSDQCRKKYSMRERSRRYFEKHGIQYQTAMRARRAERGEMGKESNQHSAARLAFKAARDAAIEREHGMCQVCEAQPELLAVIHPLGGDKDSLEGLEVLCFECAVERGPMAERGEAA